MYGEILPLSRPQEKLRSWLELPVLGNSARSAQHTISAWYSLQELPQKTSDTRMCNEWISNAEDMCVAYSNTTESRLNSPHNPFLSEKSTFNVNVDIMKHGYIFDDASASPAPVSSPASAAFPLASSGSFT